MRPVCPLPPAPPPPQGPPLSPQKGILWILHWSMRTWKRGEAYWWGKSHWRLLRVPEIPVSRPASQGSSFTGSKNLVDPVQHGGRSWSQVPDLRDLGLMKFEENPVLPAPSWPFNSLCYQNALSLVCSLAASTYRPSAFHPALPHCHPVWLLNLRLSESITFRSKQKNI